MYAVCMYVEWMLYHELMPWLDLGIVGKLKATILLQIVTQFYEMNVAGMQHLLVDVVPRLGRTTYILVYLLFMRLNVLFFLYE